MKILKQSGALIIALGVAGASLASPDQEYVCQVQTVDVKLGVVLVQADSRGGAAEIASGAEAVATDGKTGIVQSVLQCLKFPQEQFQDAQFQRFVDAMPR